MLAALFVIVASALQADGINNGGGGGGAPSGAAGGVLSGTYPNPGMASGAAATNIGTLGGDLSGTLPNPTVAKVDGVAYPTAPSTNTVPVVTGSNTVTYEAVPNAALANAATTVNGQTCTLGSSCTVTASAGTITVGTTTIASGTNGRILYDNSAVLGEATVTGSLGSVVLSASPALTGTPTAPTQSAGDNTTALATDAFVTTAVANAIAGVNPAIAVSAATTAAGDTSAWTYSNGVSGVGATFTGPVNTAITIDGITFTALTQSLLVKNDTQSPSGAFNGIYNLTALQTAGTGAIFTRRLDYDTPSDINNTGAIPVVGGTANASTSWLLTSNVATVGTSPLTYTQFSLNPTTLVVGPASATSGHIATFSGTSGKLIQDGGAVPTGTVTSVTCNGGLTGGAITASGTCAVDIATNSNIWGGTASKILDAAGAQTAIAPQTLAISTATFTPTFASGINFEITLVHASCPCTLANPTGIYAGFSGYITVIQSSTGSDLISTYGTDYKFQGGTKPVLSTGANAIDILPIYCRTTTFCAVTAGIQFQ